MKSQKLAWQKYWIPSLKTVKRSLNRHIMHAFLIISNHLTAYRPHYPQSEWKTICLFHQTRRPSYCFSPGTQGHGRQDQRSQDSTSYTETRGTPIYSIHSLLELWQLIHLSIYVFVLPSLQFIDWLTPVSTQYPGCNAHRLWNWIWTHISQPRSEYLTIYTTHTETHILISNYPSLLPSFLNLPLTPSYY